MLQIFIFYYAPGLVLNIPISRNINLFFLKNFGIENMGMITGLFPITGITLPLISAGGSSMLSYMIILAFVFQMYNEFEQKAEVTEVNATRIKN